MQAWLELRSLNALSKSHRLDEAEKGLLFKLVVYGREIPPAQITAILRAHPGLRAVLRTWGEVKHPGDDTGDRMN